MDECITTDVLIIGCGIAGGTTALRLAEAGIEVTLVTRSPRAEESNTYYAQGGIIYEGVGDSPQLLSEDIHRAGAGYCNPHAVSLLAEQGPKLVREFLIEDIGVQFDHLTDGSLSLALEGGHSLPRIVHVADSTGRAIEEALLKKLMEHPRVNLLTGCTAIDLLTPAHQGQNRLSIYQPLSCVGAYLLDQTGEQVVRCLARATIIATGGMGQIFLRTTNPAGARGDGVAMAYRAGARVINMEFVQFHPTTFYHTHAAPFLISEAVRGAGGRLVHANGEPFMQKYDPEWKDLAARDVISRSIHHEMLTHGVPNVFLDLASYIPRDTILEHFPGIHKACLQYGVDITRDLVPVSPGAHYSCGGVWVDAWGQTTIQQLYATGEVACTGLHGANRLASTSLLEGLVWGTQAAQHVRSCLQSYTLASPEDIPTWQESGSAVPDAALVRQDMSSIKHIMWNYVGLVRTAPRLARALRELRNLETEIEQFYRVTRVNDDLIGLRNAARTAVIVAAAAWSNKVSVGCHYRE